MAKIIMEKDIFFSYSDNQIYKESEKGKIVINVDGVLKGGEGHIR